MQRTLQIHRTMNVPGYLSQGRIRRRSHLGHRVAVVCASLFVVQLIAGGCNGPAHEYDSVVTGTVTVDGELAESGTVTFHPVKEGRPAIGRIYPDGSYSLRTGQGDLRESDGGTVMPGEYVVTVSITGPPVTGEVIGQGGPPVPGPSLIARKYAERETTDLRRTVKPGANVFVLELDPPDSIVSDDSSDTTETPSVHDEQASDPSLSNEQATDEPTDDDSGTNRSAKDVAPNGIEIQRPPAPEMNDDAPPTTSDDDSAETPNE